MFGKQRLFIVCEIEIGEKERCTSLMNDFLTGKVQCDILFMRVWQIKQSGVCASANTTIIYKTEFRHYSKTYQL